MVEMYNESGAKEQNSKQGKDGKEEDIKKAKKSIEIGMTRSDRGSTFGKREKIEVLVRSRHERGEGREA